VKINDAAMDRFLRSIEGLPNATSTPASDGRDARALARELYSQFDVDLKEYEKTHFPDRKLADGESVTIEDIVEADMARPPDRVNFASLRLIAAHRPESALAKWEEVKAAAREALDSGWLAAGSINGDAWERAGFLAIRERFHEVWPPRNGAEAMLLDEMAQYETLRRKLMRELTVNGWHDGVKEGKRFLGPKAMVAAVDRLQRLFQNAVRMLFVLRRARLPVTVTGSAPRTIAGDPQPAAAVPETSAGPT
jgi:hypothetical protein